MNPLGAFLIGVVVGIPLGFIYAAYLVYAFTHPVTPPDSMPSPCPGPIGINWSGIEVFVGGRLRRPYDGHDP